MDSEEKIPKGLSAIDIEKDNLPKGVPGETAYGPDRPITSKQILASYAVCPCLNVPNRRFNKYPRFSSTLSNRHVFY